MSARRDDEMYTFPLTHDFALRSVPPLDMPLVRNIRTVETQSQPN